MIDDEKIIDLFFERSEQGIRELDNKYGAVCHNLSYNIVNNRQDAEECVNDTYFRTWNAIPPARPAAFRAWLGRITRNLSLDRWNQERAQKRGGDETALLLGELNECIPAPHRTEQHLEDQALADLISAFLRTLPRENRVIFLRRYWYGESLEAIASGLGCSIGKVKSSLFRTRGKLRTYLEREGVSL